MRRLFKVLPRRIQLPKILFLLAVTVASSSIASIDLHKDAEHMSISLDNKDARDFDAVLAQNFTSTDQVVQISCEPDRPGHFPIPAECWVVIKLADAQEATANDQPSTEVHVWTENGGGATALIGNQQDAKNLFEALLVAPISYSDKEFTKDFGLEDFDVNFKIGCVKDEKRPLESHLCYISVAGVGRGDGHLPTIH